MYLFEFSMWHDLRAKSLSIDTTAVWFRMRRGLIRVVMTAAHRARLLHWRVSRAPMRGVRAIVLTPAGEIVLVRQSYTRGWHLPGGGRGRDESAEAAMLRELREEIGFTAGSIVLADERGGMLGRRPHHLATFIVRDARYSGHLSLEIEAIAAFAPDALPADIASAAGRALTLI